MGNTSRTGESLIEEYLGFIVYVRELRGKHAFSLQKKRLGVLGNNHTASKAT